MSLVYLFIYGTLQEPTVQQAIFGRTLAAQPDVLTGYTRAELVGQGITYPIAIPDPDGAIKGQVVQIPEDELILTDRYEGKAYLRAWVTLASGREAWVYRNNPDLPLRHRIRR